MGYFRATCTLCLGFKTNPLRNLSYQNEFDSHENARVVGTQEPIAKRREDWDEFLILIRLKI